MNKHEAQLLLTACRPGDLDNEDPAMREALEIMHRDPELTQWFAESQAFDAAIAHKLHGISIPASLQADILAGARVSRRQGFWSNRLTWLAAAAAVIIAGFFSLPPRHTGVATLGQYRSDVAAAFASMNANGFKPTIGVGSMAEVAKFVASQNSPLGNPQTPGGLTTIKPMACRVIDWRGQKVSIICVGREGLEAHVFVVDRRAISKEDDAELKSIVRSSDYPVAAWEDANHAYVMVGNTKTTDLKQLL